MYFTFPIFVFKIINTFILLNETKREKDHINTKYIHNISELQCGIGNTWPNQRTKIQTLNGQVYSVC